jgi:hypothetical protein
LARRPPTVVGGSRRVRAQAAQRKSKADDFQPWLPEPVETTVVAAEGESSSGGPIETRLWKSSLFASVLALASSPWAFFFDSRPEKASTFLAPRQVHQGSGSGVNQAPCEQADWARKRAHRAPSWPP